MKKKHTPMITLSKGGTRERTVKLESLHIPDAWGFAFALKKTDPRSGQSIDELWHLAHDLKRHALEQSQVQTELLEALQGILQCEAIRAIEQIGERHFADTHKFTPAYQRVYNARSVLAKVKGVL